MTTRTIAVISAGLSEPSSTRMLADRLASATQRALTQDGIDVETTVIELREHAHDITNNLVTGVPTGELGKAIDDVGRADGVIAVTPIFNAGYNGLFKSFFDGLEPDTLAGMPVLLGATGGTPRHALALEHAVRPMFTYLRSVVTPTAVYAASEDWGSGGDTTVLNERADRAAGELAALIGDRSPARRVDPFQSPTPFEQLLAG